MTCVRESAHSTEVGRLGYARWAPPIGRLETGGRPWTRMMDAVQPHATSKQSRTRPLRALVADLSNDLAHAWSRETSFDPEKWSIDNPAWGQCAVTALIVQDTLKGQLMRGTVDDVEHYWNRLPSGRYVDLTRHQFGQRVSPKLVEQTSREYVLSFPETQRRYDRLRRRLGLNGNRRAEGKSLSRSS